MLLESNRIDEKRKRDDCPPAVKTSLIAFNNVSNSAINPIFPTYLIKREKNNAISLLLSNYR